jgi:hypothetical protein
MKAKSLRRASPVLALIGTTLIGSCAERIIVTGSNNPTAEISANVKTVVFDQAGIYIPSVALNDKDRLAVDRALASYDKLLYRIETYRNGELIKTVGELPDTFIIEADKVRENARSRRLNGTALQVGFLVGTRHYATPAPPPLGGAPGRGIGTRHAQTMPPGPNPPPHPPPPQPTPPGQGIGSRYHKLETPPGGRFEPTTPGFPQGTRYESVGASEKDIGDAEKLVDRLKVILQK